MPAASPSVIKAAEPASDRSLLINMQAVLHTGGEDVILLLAPSTTFLREPLALTLPDDAAITSLGAITMLGNFSGAINNYFLLSTQRLKGSVC